MYLLISYEEFVIKNATHESTNIRSLVEKVNEYFKKEKRFLTKFVLPMEKRPVYNGWTIRFPGHKYYFRLYKIERSKEKRTRTFTIDMVVPEYPADHIKDFIEYVRDWNDYDWSQEFIEKHLDEFLFVHDDFELTTEAREHFNEYLIKCEYR